MKPDPNEFKSTEDKQKAFNDMASKMELALEPPPRSAVTVGVAFLFASKAVAVNTATPPRPVDASDEDHIKKLINDWESHAPEDFVKHWKNHATDPYVGVGTSWVGVGGQKDHDLWLESPELAEARSKYPPHSPRKVKVDNCKIVHLGPNRACATYRLEEEHQNGKTTVGNHAAILFKTNDGWRIAVSSKGGREEKR
jgi:hypothetical protein